VNTIRKATVFAVLALLLLGVSTGVEPAAASYVEPIFVKILLANSAVEFVLPRV